MERRRFLQLLGMAPAAAVIAPKVIAEPVKDWAEHSGKMAEILSRRTVTLETEINGNEAVFLVADSGGAQCMTRGLDGNIPSRMDTIMVKK